MSIEAMRAARESLHECLTHFSVYGHKLLQEGRIKHDPLKAISALDAAIKAQEAGTIPDGVYYDVLSINFYAYSGSGMGAEFYAKWFPRRFEFPKSAQPSPEPASSAVTMLNEWLQEPTVEPQGEMPSHADDEATRWRHGEPPSEEEDLSGPRQDCERALRKLADDDGLARGLTLPFLKSSNEYMCPNCVTPWTCNGPHIPEPPSEPQGDGFGIDCSPELSRAVFAEFTVSPHPAAQISDERIREIGKDVFGIDLNFDGNLITFAHALLREAAPKEGA